jgi:hypothetical protein
VRERVVVLDSLFGDIRPEGEAAARFDVTAEGVGRAARLTILQEASNADGVLVHYEPGRPT